MKDHHLKKHLEQLREIEREKHHPLIHKIHKKYKISKKTLFYVKEYGSYKKVLRTIIKESIKILLLASILSSFGGLALEYIKTVFISIMPLIVIMPTLNDMIGDYGSIISSRFSTMLHEGKIKKNVFVNKDIRKLFLQILIISILTTIITVVVALAVSYFSSYSINIPLILKIFLITLTDVILLVSILFLIAIFAGIYFFKKKEDPNNFLIPIATSVADFGNMLILSILIILFF